MSVEDFNQQLGAPVFTIKPYKSDRFLNQQQMIQSTMTLDSTSNSQKQTEQIADLSPCNAVWPSPWSSKWNPGSCRPAPFPWSTGRKAAPAPFDKSHPLFLQALPTSILLTCRPLRLIFHYLGPLGTSTSRRTTPLVESCALDASAKSDYAGLYVFCFFYQKADGFRWEEVFIGLKKIHI